MSDYTINPSLDYEASFPSLTEANLAKSCPQEEKISEVSASSLASTPSIQTSRKLARGTLMSLGEFQRTPDSTNSSLKTSSTDSLERKTNLSSGSLRSSPSSVSPASSGRTTPETVDSANHSSNPKNPKNNRRGFSKPKHLKSYNPDRPWRYYDRRVERWISLETPENMGVKEHANAVGGIDNGTYAYQSPSAKLKAHIFHGFTTKVDNKQDFSIGTTLIMGNKTAYVIPAEMDYGRNGGKGLIAYTIDGCNRCYHRFFHETNCESVLQSQLNKYAMSKEQQKEICKTLFQPGFTGQSEMIDDEKFGGKITLFNSKI